MFISFQIIHNFYELFAILKYFICKKSMTGYKFFPNKIQLFTGDSVDKFFHTFKKKL